MADNGFSQIKTDIIPLFGGLDLVTTPVLVPPGRLISSNNFEPDINGGYRRIPDSSVMTDIQDRMMAIITLQKLP